MPKSTIKVLWEVEDENKRKDVIEDQDIQKMMSTNLSIKLRPKGILKHLNISGLYFAPEYNRDWSKYS